jgi:hypothetical protein
LDDALGEFLSCQTGPLPRQAIRDLLHIEMEGQYPKHLRLFEAERFDYVITVCDRARLRMGRFWGVRSRRSSRATDEAGSPMNRRRWAARESGLNFDALTPETRENLSER